MAYGRSVLSHIWIYYQIQFCWTIQFLAKSETLVKTEYPKLRKNRAVRSGASIFGHAEAWCKENGKPLEFDTKEAAEDYAGKISGHTTANVYYYVREKEPEPGATRKRAAQLENQMERTRSGQKEGKKQKKDQEYR